MADTNLIAAHLDHRRTYKNFHYVYPVISRRSQGVSIGINLNPDKKCNFNCVYCEVDRTSPAHLQNVDIHVLTKELKQMLRIYRDGTLFEQEPFASAPSSWRRLNDIAFSGDGEPSTCPVFEQAVEAVWRVREDLGLDTTKLILITDASCLDRHGVRQGICRMQTGPNEIWAKLDAGTPEYYRVVNRSRIPYVWILKNITETARWCPVIIQSLFLRIDGKPPSDEEIRAYSGRLNEIWAQGGKIHGLHLYTMARPSAMTFASPLSDGELNHIAAMVEELTGLPYHLFYGKA